MAIEASQEAVMWLGLSFGMATWPVISELPPAIGDGPQCR